MKQISEAVWLIFRKLNLGPLLLYIHPKSELNTRGWYRSFRKRKSIDGKGKPIAWWTYAALDFLSERLPQDIRVLEFGCGGSTIWLSKRVKEVVAIENFEKWAKYIRERVDDNVSILVVDKMETFSDYQSLIKGYFELIIIDNLGDRITCAKNSVGLLSEKGIVLWDNTDGPDWHVIKKIMTGFGFKEISFSGMTPQEVAGSRTTIFYRENNCLGI